MKKQIMIVEDNAILAEAMRDYFNMRNEVIVSGIASNSLIAIEMLKTNAPDMIITDIVMPQADGFVLLEYVNKIDIPKKLEVIVLTSLNHDTNIKRASDLGAVFYIAKPFSMQDLYERVIYALENKGSMHADGQAANELPSIDQRISSLFVQVGIPAQNKGYQYLASAIKLVVEKPDLVTALTTKLYPQIGESFTTSSSSVERAIRHAIGVAFDSGKMLKINEICKSNAFSPAYKPANGEFISLAAMIVKNSSAL